VNLHDQSGPTLSRQPVLHPVFSTDVYARSKVESDQLIEKIIQENSGPATGAPRTASTSTGH
jgi:hypothetical protein